MNSTSAAGANGFIGYEYKEIAVETTKAPMYLDCYQCFGWQPDGNITSKEYLGRVTITLKRDRKILNKMELTRLQRHFEACMGEIDRLESSKTQTATIWSLLVGIVGTGFMAGSVFAVTHTPPIIWLCALLGAIGFAGWLLPLHVFKRVAIQKSKSLQPLIDQKYDELFEVCEKGNALL